MKYPIKRTRDMNLVGFRNGKSIRVSHVITFLFLAPIVWTLAYVAISMIFN